MLKTSARHKVTVALALLIVAWGGHRLVTFRAAAEALMAEAQDFRSDASKYANHTFAYESTFLRRPVSAFAGAFLVGEEWLSESATRDVQWDHPPDGIYIVVDWRCPWCPTAIDRAGPFDGQIFLLDPVRNHGDDWYRKYHGGPTPPRIMTPSDGWWAYAVPYGLTPIWFVVEHGSFTAIGIGIDDMEAKLDRRVAAPVDEPSRASTSPSTGA